MERKKRKCFRTCPAWKTPAEREAVKRLAVEMYPTNALIDIAAAAGVDQEAVRRLLKEAGVQLRRPGKRVVVRTRVEAGKVRYTEAQKRAIVKRALSMRGVPIRERSGIIGVHHTTLATWLDDLSEARFDESVPDAPMDMSVPRCRCGLALPCNACVPDVLAFMRSGLSTGGL